VPAETLRINFIGNEFRARELVGVAKQEILVLENLMNFQNLNTYGTKRVLSDGSIIDVSKSFGAVVANIVCPVGKVPSPAEKVKSRLEPYYIEDVSIVGTTYITGMLFWRRYRLLDIAGTLVNSLSMTTTFTAQHPILWNTSKASYMVANNTSPAGIDCIKESGETTRHALGGFNRLCNRHGSGGSDRVVARFGSPVKVRGYNENLTEYEVYPGPYGTIELNGMSPDYFISKTEHLSWFADSNGDAEVRHYKDGKVLHILHSIRITEGHWYYGTIVRYLETPVWLDVDTDGRRIVYVVHKATYTGDPFPYITGDLTAIREVRLCTDLDMNDYKIVYTAPAPLTYYVTGMSGIPPAPYVKTQHSSPETRACFSGDKIVITTSLQTGSFGVGGIVSRAKAFVYSKLTRAKLYDLPDPWPEATGIYELRPVRIIS
jgi:hypothetical protein